MRYLFILVAVLDIGNLHSMRNFEKHEEIQYALPQNVNMKTIDNLWLTEDQSIPKTMEVGKDEDASDTSSSVIDMDQFLPNQYNPDDIIRYEISPDVEECILKDSLGVFLKAKTYNDWRQPIIPFFSASENPVNSVDNTTKEFEFMF